MGTTAYGSHLEDQLGDAAFTGRPLSRGQIAVSERFGAATPVEAGQEKLLFDVGRGATIRLTQIGVPIGAINAVFVTHFHSDHTSGIPDLWLTGWIGRYYGNRQKPFRIIGPTGTASLMQNLERAYADDIRIRIADEKNPVEGVAISPSEYTKDGVVYESNGVKVTAFEVDHGDLIGYRVDYDGRSVIISGDTRHSQNLERHSQGATLVIHEVAIANEEYFAKVPIVRPRPLLLNECRAWDGHLLRRNARSRPRSPMGQTRA